MAYRKESENNPETCAAEQLLFERCQSCGQMVEKTYQQGICHSCLQKSFEQLRTWINKSHAAAEQVPHDGFSY